MIKLLLEGIVMQKKDVIHYLSHKKNDFKVKYGISKMIIFGSFAKDKQNTNSDLDLAIDTKESDYFLLYDLKDEIEKGLNIKVDLVRLRKRMNPYLKKRILNEGSYV